jgi:hypothetical protein
MKDQSKIPQRVVEMIKISMVPAETGECPPAKNFDSVVYGVVLMLTAIFSLQVSNSPLPMPVRLIAGVYSVLTVGTGIWYFHVATRESGKGNKFVDRKP